MKGHLNLTCSPGPNGGSHLSSQSFRAPIHLSKPHHDAGALVVNIVNPAAGIFDDDEIELKAMVESGARLVLTTPSSSRVYRSRDGTMASVRQSFHVARDAFLEFYPEPFIPHSGARYHQQNSLHVAEGSSLIFFEWLAPGRVASGESFKYDELRWDTDVWLGDKLVARERYVLNPADESLSGMRMISETAHYLGCMVLGDINWPQEAVEALGNDDVYLGCGPLSSGGWTVKAICRDALHARRTLVALRKLLHEAMGREMPGLGRF